MPVSTNETLVAFYKPPTKSEAQLKSQAIGRRVRELREAAGVPREQVAWYAGMTSNNFRHYEEGRNTLTFRVMLALARALGVELAEVARELEQVHALARCD